MITCTLSRQDSWPSHASCNKPRSPWCSSLMKGRENCKNLGQTQLIEGTWISQRNLRMLAVNQEKKTVVLKHLQDKGLRVYSQNCFNIARVYVLIPQINSYVWPSKRCMVIFRLSYEMVSMNQSLDPRNFGKVAKSKEAKKMNPMEIVGNRPRLPSTKSGRN